MSSMLLVGIGSVSSRSGLEDDPDGLFCGDEAVYNGEDQQVYCDDGE